MVIELVVVEILPFEFESQPFAVESIRVSWTIEAPLLEIS